jgi:hypothetical protein
MNQPPKRRRYAGLVDRREPPLDGFHDSGITNSDYAALLANVIAEFNNLETELPKMLAMLLGLSDETPAGYVYRAIPGVSARYHVMRGYSRKHPTIR